MAPQGTDPSRPHDVRILAQAVAVTPTSNIARIEMSGTTGTSGSTSRIGHQAFTSLVTPWAEGKQSEVGGLRMRTALGTNIMQVDPNRDETHKQIAITWTGTKTHDFGSAMAGDVKANRLPKNVLKAINHAVGSVEGNKKSVRYSMGGMTAASGENLLKLRHADVYLGYNSQNGKLATIFAGRSK